MDTTIDGLIARAEELIREGGNPQVAQVHVLLAIAKMIRAEQVKIPTEFRFPSAETYS
jgi:hypothetical protein